MRLIDADELIKQACRSTEWSHGEHPMTGPLSMIVIWGFQADDNHPIGYCTNKPDLDNANKLLQDVMQELGFFEDDKQIVNLHLSKRYTNSPGVVIYLDNAEV